MLTSVEGGKQALEELSAAQQAQVRYGLILLDMHMPQMDGFTLVEQIRRRPELSTAIVLMLTSAGHYDDAARCRELGISAHLLKPIRQSELREAIARVLGGSEPKVAIPPSLIYCVGCKSQFNTNLFVIPEGLHLPCNSAITLSFGSHAYANSAAKGHLNDKNAYREFSRFSLALFEELFCANNDCKQARY